MQINMEEVEQEKLKEYLVQCEKVFEFGCGGSTVLMSGMENIKTIHSVESDKNWVSAVKKQVGGRVNFHFVDINTAPGLWGHPKDKSKISEWPNYSGVLSKIPDYYPDLIFVDGRFRVACALKSLEKMNAQSHLMVHDYGLDRNYNVIEKWFKKVDSADTLFVFTKKENIDQEEINKAIKEYEYIDD